MKKIIEKPVENAKYFNKIINDKFADLPYVGEIRHIGLVNAIEIVKDKTQKNLIHQICV